MQTASPPLPAGPGAERVAKMQALAAMTAHSPHLCRAPLVRGLLGPKGLGMLAHSLLLGLHCSVVPECGARWREAQPRPGRDTQPWTYPLVWKAPRESSSRKSSPCVLGLFPVKR